MQFLRPDPGHFQLASIEKPFADLIAQLPLITALEQDDPRARARARIFQPPVTGDHALGEDELVQDWAELVHPDLAELFRSARDTVAQDLATLPSAPLSTLTIPRPHADAWVSCLNQARLIIHAENQFTDDEMDHDLHALMSDERRLALFTIHFYGHIQECLIDAIASDQSGDEESDADDDTL